MTKNQKFFPMGGAWLGVCLLLLLCGAPVAVSAFDWGYPELEELPSQTYYNEHIGYSESDYGTGMLRGFGGGGGDPFTPGGDKDNPDDYNASAPLGRGMIPLALLLACYIFSKGLKFRKQVQSK